MRDRTRMLGGFPYSRTQHVRGVRSNIVLVKNKNRIISLPCLRQISNFHSFITKKQAHLLCLLKKTFMLLPLREKQSIKLQSWREELNCQVCSTYY